MGGLLLGSALLEGTLEVLFRTLRDVGYVWAPVCPEKLQRLRRQPEGFRPSVRYFGLGVEVSPEELLEEGIPEELLPSLRELRPAVSGEFGGVLVAHRHWPDPVVYHSEESAELIRWMRERGASLDGARVLDLGSGAGALSFEAASRARRVLGIEAAEEAVHWARASARAQGLENAKFEQGWIGTPEADALASRELAWDVAVFNPPMAIPNEAQKRIHRDGGALGVEIPLRFLEFAGRALRRGGEVLCLATDPIRHGQGSGRGEFFKRLSPARWEILARVRVNDQFNRSLYRKEGYEKLGVERVELWLLHLRKRA